MPTLSIAVIISWYASHCVHDTSRVEGLGNLLPPRLTGDGSPTTPVFLPDERTDVIDDADGPTWCRGNQPGSVGGEGVTAGPVYDNRTGRGPGRAVRVLRAVLPSARRVWSRVDPYADAWSATTAAALSRPGRRWFVLGDSLAQGVGASTRDGGWVGRLAATLTADGHALDVVNLSATGARVGDVLAQQLPVLELIGVGEHDLVTVMVGSNDLFGSRARRDDLPAAFTQLLDRLPPGAVVATLPNPSSTAAAVNEVVERAAAAGRIVMADLRVSGPTSWRGMLAGDFFHPNDAGYAAIATGLEPAHREAFLRTGAHAPAGARTTTAVPSAGPAGVLVPQRGQPRGPRRRVPDGLW